MFVCVRVRAHSFEHPLFTPSTCSFYYVSLSSFIKESRTLPFSAPLSLPPPSSSRCMYYKIDTLVCATLAPVGIYAKLHANRLTLFLSQLGRSGGLATERGFDLAHGPSADQD